MYVFFKSKIIDTYNNRIFIINLLDFLDLNSIQSKVSEKVILEHSLFSQKNFLLSKIMITFLSCIGKS